MIRQRKPAVVQTYMGRATRLTRLPRAAAKATTHVARLGGYYKIDGYYRHADAWVGNTRGLCDYLIQSGLPAARVYNIGNFVPDPEPCADAELAALRARWRLPDEAIVLFTLGRFISIKGFDDMLQAFDKLPATVGNRPLYLIIAGDGPLAAELHGLADSLGCQQRVIWAGWQRRPGPLFELADIVICPSRHETLGNVILEAWSHVKPIVSTCTPGALELIENDVNGLLTPCQDPQRLTDRLFELLCAPGSEQQRLAQAGQDTLRRNHSCRAIVDQYLELYSLLSPGAV